MAVMWVIMLILVIVCYYDIPVVSASKKMLDIQKNYDGEITKERRNSFMENVALWKGKKATNVYLQFLLCFLVKLTTWSNPSRLRRQ